MARTTRAVFRAGLVVGLVAGLAATSPPSARAAPGWISDPESGCRTSNPFPQEGETIRWTGRCRDGLLDGAGTLIWYQDGVESERNEGVFWAGELHGPAVTTYPDGTRISGNYRLGRRDGDFEVTRPDGRREISRFENGKHVAAANERNEPVASADTARQVPLAPPPRSTAARRSTGEAALHSERTESPDTASASVVVDLGVLDVLEPVARRSAPPLNAPASPLSLSPGTGAGSVTPSLRPVARLDARAPLRPEVRGFERAIFDDATIVVGTAAPKPPARHPIRVAAAGSYDLRPYLNPDRGAAGSRLAAAPARLVPTPVRRAMPAPRRQPSAPVLAALPAARLVSAEERFVQAFAAEQEGRYDAAARGYQDILRHHPASDSAGLARVRLAGITRRPAPATPRGRGPANRDPSMVGAFVCTVRGLYPSDTRWCGVVRGEDANYLRVEVKNVRVSGFFNVGISRTTCSGNTFLTRWTRGVGVTVPKNCMGPTW